MASKELLIVSGVQPTGRLHIGNWAGGLRNWLALQDAHPERCLFFIADYHALTVEYDPKDQQNRILDVAASLLALGFDSKKSTLFVQSDVPEHTELAWILNCVTPVAEMERMTQYKDKSSKHAKNINMGLLGYPVLQAADILIYGGNAVPVGQDQVQHVETTRVIARNFNKRFGAVFPEPKALLNDTPKVMSLTEPTKKMSKSGLDKSYIAIDDEPEVILKKMRGVPTEPTGLVTEEALATEAFAGVALLLDLIELCEGKAARKAALAESPVKYGDLKTRAAEAVAARFADFRAKKKELLKNPDRIRMVLASGGAKARAHAKQTMETVLKATGLR
ncbi:MAG TPA: tryptophan--tRNA ligase [Candidatus Baltobacteraceae bacterium]|nr:tryptophan--tRNA ligase [Candidatus Baltobacteraceae bacterium]